MKCSSCGAGLTELEKYCSYCGTINANAKEQETQKEVLNETSVDDDFGLDDVGEILSSVLIGGVIGSSLSRARRTHFNGPRPSRKFDNRHPGFGGGMGSHRTPRHK